jgi:hypothetical protein
MIIAKVLIPNWGTSCYFYVEYVTIFIICSVHARTLQGYTFLSLTIPPLRNNIEQKFFLYVQYLIFVILKIYQHQYFHIKKVPLIGIEILTTIIAQFFSQNFRRDSRQVCRLSRH